jgi:hypothetical protein
LNYDTPHPVLRNAQGKIWGIFGAISGQMLNICPEIALVEAYRGIDRYRRRGGVLESDESTRGGGVDGERQAGGGRPDNTTRGWGRTT